MIGPGDLLRKRYRIERSIGRGGMGEVFSAVVLVPAAGKEGDVEATLVRPSVDSFRVAIKVVSLSVVSEAAMARLQREAIAAARIKSAFVPELIEVSTTEDGELFLAMEILYGTTLSARLKGRKCLHWEEAFLLGDDVLSGLIDAHEAGVIHRDLKPSNIFLCERKPPDLEERAKVLDFGVCKLDTPDEEKLTGTGESVGTVAYMAPEQIRGASQVTARADLYSFGTVMFEALSGELPHHGAGQMALLASKLERSPRRLAEVAQVPVPARLDALLERLLARDPERRFASAREVREAWRALGPAEVAPSPGVEAPQALLVASEPMPTETGIATGAIELSPPYVSRVGIALAAFSVTVSTIVILIMIGSRSEAKTPAAADFNAEEAPTVPTWTIASADAPPVPFAFELDSGLSADEHDAADPDRVDVPPVAVPVTPRPASSHPAHPAIRPWSKPAPSPSPTKPRIADKPRY